MRDFNEQVKNGYGKLTLKKGFYDSAMLHIGLNAPLYDKSSSSTDNLISNLVNVVNKCKSF